jgi:stage III sporulation protein AA
VRQVSGLNMRVARAIRGPGEDLLSRLGDAISPRSFLIAGAPRSGKTTLLRDLVRRYGDSGQRVVVVDERSEIAGFGGAGDTGFDVGLHTDVLDGWPKADGIRIAVRTLGPDVVAVDELGGHHDAQAIAQARYAGVRVVATIHAGGRLDLTRHQSIWPLIQDGVFDGVVFLSSRPGPGSLTDLWMGPDQ